MSQYEFTATDQDKGLRLDVFLVDRLPKTSRTHIQKLIMDGCILIDGDVNRIPHHKLKMGERLIVHYLPIHHPPSTIQPEDIPLDIVYEDDSVLVINKPVGMVTHPAPGNWSKTLVNAVLYHCSGLKTMGDTIRPGIVHRLDKDTSGLIILAKNEEARMNLSGQLKSRQMKRKYVSMVEGFVQFDEGSVDAPIGRHPRNRKKMAVVYDRGRTAVTHYRVLERFPDQTLLELSLDTGRTHQIRVHMAHIGHPVVGDTLYYGHPSSAKRMMLHAFFLKFSHPVSNEPMEFKIDYDIIK